MQYNVTYIYQLGEHNSTRTFSFTTPPKVGPDVPYTFGIIGEHDSTIITSSTLSLNSISASGFYICLSVTM